MAFLFERKDPYGYFGNDLRLQAKFLEEGAVCVSLYLQDLLIELSFIQLSEKNCLKTLLFTTILCNPLLIQILKSMNNY